MSEKPSSNLPILAASILASFSMTSQPIFAAIIPPMDIKPGELALDVGLLSASVNVGLDRNWSVGGAGVFLPSNNFVALSTSYHFGSPFPWLIYGLTLSAGGAVCCFGSRMPFYSFLEPALGLSLRVDDVATLRASLGPALMYIPSHESFPGFVTLPDSYRVFWDPNLELSLYATEIDEVTLGIKSFVSYRRRWK